MAGHRIYKTSVASVYPHYVSKVEKKGRSKEELDEILYWLTGYDARACCRLRLTAVSKGCGQRGTRLAHRAAAQGCRP
jgi:hypothetical protein